MLIPTLDGCFEAGDLRLQRGDQKLGIERRRGSGNSGAKITDVNGALRVVARWEQTAEVRDAGGDSHGLESRLLHGATDLGGESLEELLEDGIHVVSCSRCGGADCPRS